MDEAVVARGQSGGSMLRTLLEVRYAGDRAAGMMVANAGMILVLRSLVLPAGGWIWGNVLAVVGLVVGVRWWAWASRRLEGVKRGRVPLADLRSLASPREVPGTQFVLRGLFPTLSLLYFASVLAMACGVAHCAWLGCFNGAFRLMLLVGFATASGKNMRRAIRLIEREVAMRDELKEPLREAAVAAIPEQDLLARPDHRTAVRIVEIGAHQEQTTVPGVAQ